MDVQPGVECRAQSLSLQLDIDDLLSSWEESGCGSIFAYGPEEAGAVDGTQQQQPQDASDSMGIDQMEQDTCPHHRRANSADYCRPAHKQVDASSIMLDLSSVQANLVAPRPVQVPEIDISPFLHMQQPGSMANSMNRNLAAMCGGTGSGASAQGIFYPFGAHPASCTNAFMLQGVMGAGLAPQQAFLMPPPDAYSGYPGSADMFKQAAASSEWANLSASSTGLAFPAGLPPFPGLPPPNLACMPPGAWGPMSGTCFSADSMVQLVPSMPPAYSQRGSPHASSTDVLSRQHQALFADGRASCAGVPPCPPICTQQPGSAKHADQSSSSSTSAGMTPEGPLTSGSHPLSAKQEQQVDAQLRSVQSCNVLADVTATSSNHHHHQHQAAPATAGTRPVSPTSSLGVVPQQPPPLPQQQQEQPSTRGTEPVLQQQQQVLGLKPSASNNRVMALEHTAAAQVGHVLEVEVVRTRTDALARYREKRAHRAYTKKIRYQLRKINADRRPRIKGRFVKKEEMHLYPHLFKNHAGSGGHDAGAGELYGETLLMGGEMSKVGYTGGRYPAALNMPHSAHDPAAFDLDIDLAVNGLGMGEEEEGDAWGVYAMS